MSGARPTAELWTDADDDVLRVGLHEGLTEARIGELLRRTVRSVHNRRVRLGLTHPVAVVDRARLLELYAAGAGVETIAAELGCTWRTVEQLVSVERGRLAERGEPVDHLARPVGRRRRVE